MKTGDKVKFIGTWEPYGPTPGQRGVIVEIDEDGDILVKLDGAPDNVYPLSFQPSDLEVVSHRGKEE